VAVTGGLIFKTITAGGAHSCGLIADGTAYCWGRNASYQLGDNTNIQRDVPTPVSGGLYFTSIYGSSEHSCGITSTGSSYCWGYNADGQLGDTSNTTRQVPTLVSGGYTFAGIGDGGSHTCASTLSGAAYCWGQNVYAQVGDNSNFGRNAPVPVNSSGTYPYLFSQVSSGTQHTCALAEPDYSLRLTSIGHYMGFLKDDGSIWYRSSATGWTKLSSGSDAFIEIAGNNVGGGRKADGSVYKWTDLTTNFGTGYKRYASSYDIYFAIDGSETAYYQYSWFINPWTAFSTGARYKDVFGGYGHYCGITIDGTMHCWGSCAASGCLGNGTTGAGIPVLGGSSWIKGNATRYTTCGIQRDSTLWCWGSNTNGEVGAGDTSPHNSPTQVGVLKWKSISGAKSGMAGSYTYFCGVTVDGDGYCWGYTATNGNLGSNISNYASTPQKVIGGYKWLHIAATAFEACGITTSKQIYCWGGADYYGGGGMGGSYGYTPRLQVGVP
jgi:alpha-tubulin suppressor-like RCC1 family protein